MVNLFCFHISCIFSYILNSGKYPKLWSHGLILSICKSGNTQDPCNYRGIAITRCLVKLFNGLMNKRSTSFLTENGIICDDKLAFVMVLEQVIISLN